MATDLEIQRGKELMEWQATTIELRAENDRLWAALIKIRTALEQYYEGKIGVKGMCEDIGTVFDNECEHIGSRR